MLYIRIHNLMLADHVQTTYALRRGPQTNLNDIDAKQNIYIRNTVMTNRRTGWICTQTCVVVYYSNYSFYMAYFVSFGQAIDRRLLHK